MKTQLVLVYDTAAAYAERTGKCFWEDLSPTEQRKELENFKEDARGIRVSQCAKGDF